MGPTTEIFSTKIVAPTLAISVSIWFCLVLRLKVVRNLGACPDMQMLCKRIANLGFIGTAVITLYWYAALSNDRLAWMILPLIVSAAILFIVLAIWSRPKQTQSST